MPDDPLLVPNRVRDRLARDEVVLSMTVRLVRSVEIGKLAATSGFDSIYIDLEHSTIGLDTASQICIAAQDAGVAPFVRVPSNEAAFISRILDNGALGIIAPHIETAADARAVVELARYRPIGKRSAAGAVPQLGFRRHPVLKANAAMQDATTVVVMIETRAALDHVEEIAAVEGVDILFIGAVDLCGELGIPGQLDHKLIEDAYLRTIAASRANGKHTGIGGLASRTDLLGRFVKAGARYVSTGTDLDFLLKSAGERAAALRKL